MRVSVVILSFDSVRTLGTCVEATLGALEAIGATAEVIVVENGSTDGSAEVLRGLEAAHPESVQGIYEAVNTGTTRSRNRALARCTGDPIVILDSDVVELGPGLLEHLLEHLDDPSVGLVCPRLVHADGRPQLSTDVYPTVARKLVRWLALRALERTGATLVKPVDVDVAISAFWMMPRRVLEEVGPLDEVIFYSPEDVDYCIRLGLAGYRIRYDPRVQAVHDAGEIGRSAWRSRRFFVRHAAGLIYLFRKHRYGWLGRGRLRARVAAARRARVRQGAGSPDSPSR